MALFQFRDLLSKRIDALSDTVGGTARDDDCLVAIRLSEISVCCNDEGADSQVENLKTGV